MKSGVTTSEFWLTVLGVGALVALVLADKLDGNWAAPAIAFACFGYQATRAIVKKEAVGADAAVADFRADLASLVPAEVPPARVRK